MDKYAQTLADLQQNIGSNDFKGYDPYDVLKSPLPFQWLGKWGPILAIQATKRSPVNLRSLLGIPKGENPKGIGLLLNAYSQMSDPDEELLKKLFERLLDLRTKDATGYAWGYDFPWASPIKFLPAWSPTIVVTGFIAQGIFAYYKITKDPMAMEVLEGISAFMLSLPTTENESGICFSYSSTMQDICFNASMLGAEHFARMYSLTMDERSKELALKATSFTIQHQLENGAWPYSLNKEGEARMQVDFHQGFVICSLLEVIEHLKGVPEEWNKALTRGVEFYRREQFTEEGRSLWRWPKKWPIDIHHQAQGIITFSRLGNVEFAQRIADWTIDNMCGNDGSFYYRVHRWGKDRSRYMRWGQAWMALALAELINSRAK